MLYCYALVWLVGLALVPALLLGWTPVAITTGSMAPRIPTGDVLLVQRDADVEALRAGAVVTFDDPAVDGRVVTHRIVSANPDGTYVTRGDANGTVDSTPVPPSAIRGVGRLVVPVAALPVTWLRDGQLHLLAGWLVGTGLACAYARQFARLARQPLSWTMTLPSSPPRRPKAVAWWSRMERFRPAQVVGTSVLAVLLALGGLANGAFSAATANPGNAFSAAYSFGCGHTGTQTLIADADTFLNEESPNQNYGSSATQFGTQSQGGGKNARSLLHFPLPSVSSNCELTSATLRVYATAVNKNRTVQAYGAAAAWTESGVTWNTKPGSSGTPTATTLSATGWKQWDVTDLTAALYAGVNHGFLLRDASENDSPGNGGGLQAMSPREGSYQPELVLTFNVPGPPAAPSNLVATASSSSQIDLSWTDNATDENGFAVERSTDSGASWTTVATIAAGATGYSDMGLAASTRYDYRVLAYNGGGASAYTDIAFTTTDGPPAAPSALSATTVSSSRIDLSWTDNATNETGFVVERSPAGAATWTEVATRSANVTTYANTGLTAETAYDYRVRAANASGDSDWSNVATATTDALSQPPAAPTGLSATAVSTAAVDLAWTDESATEDGFKIERSPGGLGDWTEVGTVPAGATTYSDTGLIGETAYDYRVRAHNGGGDSAYSNVASATTADCGSQTLTSAADAMVYEGLPTVNYGTSAIYFGTRSDSTGDSRSLVTFDLAGAPVPDGCAVASATLRLYISSGVAGHSLQAVRATGTWTESAVTWSSQPTTDESTISTAGSVAAGWVEWDVTTQTGALYAGTNDGFLVRDAVEGASTTRDQGMIPREGSDPSLHPQLVVEFG